MTIPESSIRTRTELVDGRKMHFASATVAGQIYVGYGNDERSAKYHLMEQIRDERHRNRPKEVQR